MRRLKRLLPMLAIGAIVLVAVAGGSGVLTMRDLTGADVLTLLTPLFLVSLFNERALEVFLVAWRVPQRQLLEADPARADELLRYQTETLRLSLYAVAILGVIEAAVGFRALEHVIADDALAGIGRFQSAAFSALDTLLSGALLGGGASALHSLVSLFVDFLDTTRARLPSAATTKEEA